MLDKIILIQKILDRIIFWVLVIVLGVMVIMVVGQVFARFILNNPSQIVEELLRYSLIWSVMLGAVSVFIHNEHIALTSMLDKATPKKRKVLHIIINSITVTFLALVMVYGGVKLVTGAMYQLTPMLNVPMGLVYLILPVSGALMIFVVVLQTLEVILGHDTTAGGI